MLGAIEVRKLLRNLGVGLGLGGVCRLQQLDTLLVDPRQFRGDRALGHGPVERLFGGHKGVGRAVVAIDAVHYPPFALGNAAAHGRRRKDGLRAIFVALLDPGNCGAGRIGGDVLDVAQVYAVNAGQMRKRIPPAQMQYHHRLRFGILLVVGKGGLDQQLFSDKPGWRVAALADISRRTQVLHRRWNRRGIVGYKFGSYPDHRMKTDFNKLLGAVYLGGKIRSRARADVAVNARHMRVRGDVIGRVFRMHHMAGLPAKLRRIHVGGAAIAGYGHDQQVGDGSHKHDVKAVAKDPVVEIDLGKFSRNLPGFHELSAAQKHAHRDQQQSGHKQGRQQQEEDDSEIGVVIGPAEDLHQPIADHGYAGGAGDGPACKAYGVVAEEQSRPHPAFTEFLKH